MKNAAADHQERLKDIAQASPWFMRALQAASELSLPSWCIGAGAGRNLVWDYLHGYTSPSLLSDIDLAYFDQDELPSKEHHHQKGIKNSCPDLPWEVTNQAHVICGLRITLDTQFRRFVTLKMPLPRGRSSQLLLG
jgi:uncharacterized protein